MASASLVAGKADDDRHFTLIAGGRHRCRWPRRRAGDAPKMLKRMAFTLGSRVMILSALMTFSGFRAAAMSRKLALAPVVIHQIRIVAIATGDISPHSRRCPRA